LAKRKKEKKSGIEACDDEKVEEEMVRQPAGIRRLLQSPEHQPEFGHHSNFGRSELTCSLSYNHTVQGKADVVEGCFTPRRIKHLINQMNSLN